MRLSNLTIRGGIAAGFIIVLMVFAIPVAYSVYTNYTIQRNASELEKVLHVLLEDTSEMLTLLQETRLTLTAAISEAEPGYVKRAETIGHEFKKRSDEIRRLNDGANIRDIAELYDRYLKTGVAAATQISSGRSLVGIADEVSKLESMAGDLKLRVEDHYKYHHERFIDNISTTSRHSQRAMYLTLGAFVLAIIAGTWITTRLSGNIADRIGLASDKMKDFAYGGGDLTQTLDLPQHDEIGRMAENFNLFMQNLRDIIRMIKTTSDGIATTSSHITVEAGRLSRGAEHQDEAASVTLRTMNEMFGAVTTISSSAESLAGNAQETFEAVQGLQNSVVKVEDNAIKLTRAMSGTISSIQEMSTSIGEVAKGADVQSNRTKTAAVAVDRIAQSIEDVLFTVQQADSIARRNAETGETGRKAVRQAEESMNTMIEVMRSTVDAIQKLGERSSQIADIVRFVDDIGEKTRLLALNAAIIAAQAGEHGKGFAVVANQVGQLADRSMTATKTIESVIRDILKETSGAVILAENTLRETEESVRLSQEAGGSILDIMEGLEQSATLFTRVSDACVSQKRIAEEVVDAMDALNLISEQVRTAMSQQLAASKRIGDSAENVMEIAEDVRFACQEQTQTTALIASSINDIEKTTHAVAAAAAQQRAGGQNIVTIMANVKEISGGNLESVKRLLAADKKLVAKSDDMVRLVTRFTT
ncbi:MAG: methyl-accepting chemotaxis protein [Nitrospirae bacterium]|nr:methyl-accepting chemotaxis protein [Nitrospirota bacterium]